MTMVVFQPMPHRMSASYSGVSDRKMLTDMVRFPNMRRCLRTDPGAPTGSGPKIFNRPCRRKVQYEADLRTPWFEMTPFGVALTGGRAARAFLEIS